MQFFFVLPWSLYSFCSLLIIEHDKIFIGTLFFFFFLTCIFSFIYCLWAMTYSRENLPKHIAIYMRMKQQFHLNALRHGKLSTNPPYDFRATCAIISNNRNNIVTRSYKLSASLFAHPITFWECFVAAKVTGYYDGVCDLFL